MNTIWTKIKIVAKDSLLRKKILFVLLGLVLFRVLAAIPIPGVDAAQLEIFFNNNQFLNILNVFSGSGLSTLSLVMLGVGPYINASIIMQLLSMVFPKIKALYQEEGDAGRAKFTQYSRRLTVFLAIIQAYGFLILLTKQGLLAPMSTLAMVTSIGVITAGSVVLMWIGELMTEYGIGNGLSMIIFAGIVASIPQHASQLWLAIESDPSSLTTYIGFGILALLAIWAVVVMNEAERAIPVTYAKQVRGNPSTGGASTYLPLKINQAGVIPIIFALSLLLFPELILNFLKLSDSQTIKTVAETILVYLKNAYIHAVLYFILVFVFTYFYTAVTFDPKNIAENLQKNGAFIPGVRPGNSTMEYLANVVTRITLVGALFLSIIAVLPLAVQAFSGNSAFAIGGTALLIVVSVVIDLLNKINAQIAMREY